MDTGGSVGWEHRPARLVSRAGSARGAAGAVNATTAKRSGRIWTTGHTRATASPRRLPGHGRRERVILW